MYTPKERKNARLKARAHAFLRELWPWAGLAVVAATLLVAGRMQYKERRYLAGCERLGDAQGRQWLECDVRANK